jgi:hypothetical protein
MVLGVAVNRGALVKGSAQRVGDGAEARSRVAGSGLRRSLRQGVPVGRIGINPDGQNSQWPDQLIEFDPASLEMSRRTGREDLEPETGLEILNQKNLNPMGWILAPPQLLFPATLTFKSEENSC